MSADADTDESERPDRFPTPPRTVADGADRDIIYRTAAARDPSVPADGDAVGDERAALAAMYDAFGTADRAQGIPPADPDRRRRWLDGIAGGIGVVAWHGDDAVGHGVLLAGGPGHELALFVHPDYRRAGVGTALLRTLLGRGRDAGVERVWLSVRRTNRPAVRLYRRAGFAPARSAAGELEMARPLREGANSF